MTGYKFNYGDEVYCCFFSKIDKGKIVMVGRANNINAAQAVGLAVTGNFYHIEYTDENCRYFGEISEAYPESKVFKTEEEAKQHTLGAMDRLKEKCAEIMG